MSAPTLQFFEVIQNLYEAIITNTTNPDGGNTPLAQTIEALVLFTPSISQIVDSELDMTIELDPIQGRVNAFTPEGAPDGALRSLDGTLGVELVDNQFLGLMPGQLIYTVSFTAVEFDNISGRTLPPFAFAAPGDASTIDLNTVTRLQPPTP
jgi:hypothetical protein